MFQTSVCFALRKQTDLSLSVIVAVYTLGAFYLMTWWQVDTNICPWYQVSNKDEMTLVPKAAVHL